MKKHRFITISQEDNIELTEKQNKRLAEFADVQWHKKRFDYPRGWQPDDLMDVRCSCGRDIDVHLCVNPDFSTPDGLELLTDKISDPGEWPEFIDWIRTCDNRNNTKHEMGWWSSGPAEKSALIYEALQAGVIGKANEKLAPGESDPRD